MEWEGNSVVKVTWGKKARMRKKHYQEGQRLVWWWWCCFSVCVFCVLEVGWELVSVIVYFFRSKSWCVCWRKWMRTKLGRVRGGAVPYKEGVWVTHQPRQLHWPYQSCIATSLVDLYVPQISQDKRIRAQLDTHLRDLSW